MFCLIEFENGGFWVCPRNNVQRREGENQCSVKFKGGRYKGNLIMQSDDKKYLIQQMSEYDRSKKNKSLLTSEETPVFKNTIPSAGKCSNIGALENLVQTSKTSSELNKTSAKSNSYAKYSDLPSVKLPFCSPDFKKISSRLNKKPLTQISSVSESKKPIFSEATRYTSQSVLPKQISNDLPATASTQKSSLGCSPPTTNDVNSELLQFSERNYNNTFYSCLETDAKNSISSAEKFLNISVTEHLVQNNKTPSKLNKTRPKSNSYAKYSDLPSVKLPCCSPDLKKISSSLNEKSLNQISSVSESKKPILSQATPKTSQSVLTTQISNDMPAKALKQKSSLDCYPPTSNDVNSELLQFCLETDAKNSISSAEKCSNISVPERLAQNYKTPSKLNKTGPKLNSYAKYSDLPSVKLPCCSPDFKNISSSLNEKSLTQISSVFESKKPILSQATPKTSQSVLTTQISNDMPAKALKQKSSLDCYPPTANDVNSELLQFFDLNYNKNYQSCLETVSKNSISSAEKCSNIAVPENLAQKYKTPSKLNKTTAKSNSFAKYSGLPSVKLLCCSPDFKEISSSLNQNPLVQISSVSEIIKPILSEATPYTSESVLPTQITNDMPATALTQKLSCCSPPTKNDVNSELLQWSEHNYDKDSDSCTATEFVYPNLELSSATSFFEHPSKSDHKILLPVGTVVDTVQLQNLQKLPLNSFSEDADSETENFVIIVENVNNSLNTDVSGTTVEIELLSSFENNSHELKSDFCEQSYMHNSTIESNFSLSNNKSNSSETPPIVYPVISPFQKSPEVACNQTFVLSDSDYSSSFSKLEFHQSALFSSDLNNCNSGSSPKEIIESIENNTILVSAISQNYLTDEDNFDCSYKNLEPCCSKNIFNSTKSTTVSTPNNTHSEYFPDTTFNRTEEISATKDILEERESNVSLISDPVKLSSIKVPHIKSASKKHFCLFCKTLQTKLARHFFLKHKKEREVKQAFHLPIKSKERLSIINSLRKKGDFIHNTSAEYNTGILIVSRQQQVNHKKSADDYVSCRNCKGFFTKNALRNHLKKCGKQIRNLRDNFIQSRKMTQFIHKDANYTVRNKIFPVLRDDDISRVIRYDHLIILYANYLTLKHTLAHQDDMIRSRLRLLGRFLVAIKTLNKDINELKDIFKPGLFDTCVNALRIVAKWDENLRWFRTPAVAQDLSSLIKKVAKRYNKELIKVPDADDKIKDLNNFTILWEGDIPVLINQKALEDQITQKRTKKVILPSKDDIKKLYYYLRNKMFDAMRRLEKEFDFNCWSNLVKSSLISIQIFNRRRAGEIERLSIKSFLNKESITENIDREILKNMSDESLSFAKQFVRLTLRGKLGRTVSVLLSPLDIKAIEYILKYQSMAGVAKDNEFIFARKVTSTFSKPYLRACPLLKQFSEECGAEFPDSLRGTFLRKHIATYTSLLNIEEATVDRLANFMGHHKDIHKSIYRVSVPVAEITCLSKLLLSAVGGDDDDEDEDDDNNNDNDNGQYGGTEQYDNVEHYGSNGNFADNEIISNRSVNELNSSKNTSFSSTKKKRSTSPFGKTKRTKWCQEEKDVVYATFGDLKKLSKLPTLKQCFDVVSSNAVLKDRTAEMLKTWIDNQRRYK